MKLFLMRHGETDWNADGRFQGHTHVLLNGQGREQARRAAAFFKTVGPCRLYASRLARAVETAQYIEQACGVTHLTDERLNEISFGQWEGLSWRQVEERYPELYEDWKDLKSEFRPPGGQALEEISKNIRSFFTEMSESDETIIAISHGGPIRLLLLELLKLPVRAFRSIRIDPASVTCVERSSRAIAISTVNLNGGLV